MVEPKGKLTKDNLCYWLLVANGCDNFIYKNFFPLWERAKNNELDKWLLNPVKTVALVIMLDQFTRCIYRDTPQMFSMDERTLEIVELALEKNFDKQLAPAMRLWLYLPLIRKEDVAVSCKLQSLVEELVVETDPEEKEFWGSVMNYIQVHQQILKQHGRYPMINEALGRKSTFLEALWLRTNPSDFSYF
uniref:DUF924 domain-containing protein n=1 Tax=Arcella intermedia TaxID=1963864 RepID=A0A6B2LJB5_9EUKA